MANSGEDSYEESFKLLVAKLYDELTADSVQARKFSSMPQPAETREVINDILDRVAKRWPGTLDVSNIGLSDEHLAVCVAEIAPLSLLDRNIEIVDDLFEHLVSADAKGNKGQYFTPRHVIDLAVRLVDPKPGESIVDPSCGSGGFLVHSLNHARGYDSKYVGQESIWGFDFDSRAVRVARTLLRISGVDTPSIFTINSLIKPNSQEILFRSSADDLSVAIPTIEGLLKNKKVLQGGFDVLFANPPFAGEIREQHILQSYEVGLGRDSIERDALFWERCIELLKPGGRFAIILPHNKLAGSTWAPLRQWVMRRAKISIVVGLPRPTFMPHTPQKTALIVGEKRLRALPYPPKNEEIMFAVSDEIGKDSAGRLIRRVGSDDFGSTWERADHDLQSILDSYYNSVKNCEVA